MKNNIDYENKKAGEELNIIFMNFDENYIPLFIRRLERWNKRYENISIPIEVIPDFSDVMANIDFSFEKGTIEFTSIKIGLDYLKHYKKYNSSGYLIELGIYKNFKDKKLIQILNLLGSSHAIFLMFELIFINMKKGITDNNSDIKDDNILDTIIKIIGLTIIIEFIFLLYTWNKLSRHEYDLNAKYYLINETIFYYNNHRRTVYLLQSKNIEFIKQMSHLLSLFIDNVSFTQPEKMLCRFLIEVKEVAIKNNNERASIIVKNKYKKYCLNNKYQELDSQEIKEFFKDLNKVIKREIEISKKDNKNIL